MSIGRGQAWVAGLAVLVIAACSGGGGGGGGGGETTGSGLTANFTPDVAAACPGTADSLTLRKASALGRNVTLGLQVTDCDASLAIYGVVFDIKFDPTVMRCASSNPCSAGTVLTAPLLTSTPQCTCDNAGGEIVGAFTKKSPGTNDTLTGGSQDIVQFTLQATHAGQGRVDLLGSGSVNGTALVSLTGAPGDPPTAIPGLAYAGGTLTAQ